MGSMLKQARMMLASMAFFKFSNIHNESDPAVIWPTICASTPARRAITMLMPGPASATQIMSRLGWRRR